MGMGCGTDIVKQLNMRYNQWERKVELFERCEMVLVREQKFLRAKIFFLVFNSIAIITCIIIAITLKGHYKESINSIILLLLINCHLVYCLFFMNREKDVYYEEFTNVEEEEIQPQAEKQAMEIDKEEKVVKKSMKGDNNMEEVFDFLKKCGTFYLATEEGNQPRVRPFGALNIYDGRLYIQTGKSKNVSKQMQVNPNVEISGFADGKWIRLEGKVVRDDRREAKADMLEHNPELKGMYSADDDNTEVLYFENAKATFWSFTEAPRVVKF